jgi:4-amino-4-deoxy-L-arabinose transferase-like glycosyltransferase
VRSTSSHSRSSVLAPSRDADAPGSALGARTLVALGLILLVALAFRALWLVETDAVIPPLSDPQYYHATATNLAEGRGYTVAVDDRGFVAGPQSEATAFWAPGFSFALAPLYKLFGAESSVAKALNAVAGALTVVPVFFIGRRLRGDACGLLAAAIFALTPALVFWTASVFSEPLFTLGVATTLALAMHAGDPPSGAWCFAVGVALIATAFVRSQGLVLIVPVAVMLVPRLEWSAAARSLVPVAAAVALFVVPWAIRNEVAMGEPWLINNNLGYNLRLAHAPYSTGTSVPPQDLWDEQPGISFKQREILFDDLGRERAIDYALSHPRREAELAVKRVLYLLESDAAASINWSESLGRTPLDRWRDAYVLIGDVYWYAMLALAAASLALFPRTREWWALWSTIAVWIALHTVFAGEPRYHVPLIPVIAALAAASLASAARVTDHLRLRT